MKRRRKIEQIVKDCIEGGTEDDIEKLLIVLNENKYLPILNDLRKAFWFNPLTWKALGMEYADFFDRIRKYILKELRIKNKRKEEDL